MDAFCQFKRLLLIRFNCLSRDFNFLKTFQRFRDICQCFIMVW